MTLHYINGQYCKVALQFFLRLLACMQCISTCRNQPGGGGGGGKWKHSANDATCSELGWTCIPLVVESYGAWGREAIEAFSRLASLLATRTNTPKSKVVSNLYGRLNLTLVRANAQSLLLRCIIQEGDSYKPKLNFVVSVFYLFVYHCISFNCNVRFNYYLYNYIV